MEGGALLSEHVKRAGGPLPLNETLHCLLGIARALVHAHSKGKTHNDISSSSILFKIQRDSLGNAFFDTKINAAAGEEGAISKISYLSPENFHPAQYPNYDHKWLPLLNYFGLKKPL